MRFASSCIPFIEKAERNISHVLDKALSEKKDKTYIGIISELKAFTKNVKRFLTIIKTLESFYPNLRHGRVCFKWIYTEIDDILSFIRLEPALTLLFTGNSLRITYDDRTLTMHEQPRINISINQYNDVIDLLNEEEVITKRSLISNSIVSMNQQIEKAIENLGLCIKYIRHKI